jgi:small-conductance mechanosensitive channel
MGWLDREIYGNAAGAWLLSIALVVLAWMLLWVARLAIGARLSRLATRTTTSLDDLAADLIARTHGAVVVVIALASGGLLLRLPPGVNAGLRLAAGWALVLQLGLWGNSLITFGTTRYARRRLEHDPATVTTVSVLSFTGRLLLWSLLLLVALDNVGVDITALVAGLGIGGIAVALALQNVLGDLFAAFAIALDRPFSIGDFIIVDELLGTVEHIGLKTTRIRSLSGEQVAISNGNLLDRSIHNYKRMAERRVVFTIGVTYETSQDVVEAIPGMLREIVEEQRGVRFDRVHFKTFGDFALIFEVVYYVLSPDYGMHMDIQQAINLAVFRRFGETGISFAYPTHTLHLRWSPDGAALIPAGRER